MQRHKAAHRDWFRTACGLFMQPLSVRTY